MMLKRRRPLRRLGAHVVLGPETFRVRLICGVGACCMFDSGAFRNVFYVFEFLQREIQLKRKHEQIKIL